jgi:hypothetical protein
LLIVGNARQPQAVNFLILPHQGIVRPMQHWQPHDMTMMVIWADAPLPAKMLSVTGVVMKRVCRQSHEGQEQYGDEVRPSGVIH